MHDALPSLPDILSLWTLYRQQSPQNTGARDSDSELHVRVSSVQRFRGSDSFGTRLGIACWCLVGPNSDATSTRLGRGRRLDFEKRAQCREVACILFTARISEKFSLYISRECNTEFSGFAIEIKRTE